MLNWYLETGKDSDIVVSSKVRLSRNLSQFNFYIKSIEELQKEEDLIRENLNQIGYGLRLIKLKDLEEISIKNLIEKNIIPEKVVKEKEKKSILINDEENICILINQEDHFKIQVFASGFELEGISNLVIEIDEKLQQIFNIAKNEKYGFLTSNLTNLGTGIKASVILHLPGLVKTKNISKIIKLVNQFGMEILKENQADMYRIYNKPTFGISEQDIIKHLKIIVEKIIEQERTARKILAGNEIFLEDKIYRSYGTLSNCKKISQKEAEELLSEIKLGTDLGILTNLTDAKIKKLYLYVKSANLQKYSGQELKGIEEEIKRAEIAKKIIEGN
jgi:protein arginine kinase